MFQRLLLDAEAQIVGVGFKQVVCYLWYKICFLLDVQSLTCPFTLKQVFVMFFDILRSFIATWMTCFCCNNRIILKLHEPPDIPFREKILVCLWIWRSPLATWSMAWGLPLWFRIGDAYFHLVLEHWNRGRFHINCEVSKTSFLAWCRCH